MNTLSSDLRLEPALGNIRGRVGWLQPLPGALGLSVGIWTLLIGGSVYGAASAGLFAYSLTWFAESLGQEFDLVPIIAVVATGQWLLGPSLAYSLNAVTDRYSMYVDESTYFDYVLPATIAFLGALRAFSPQIGLAELGRHLRSAAPLPPRTVRILFVVGLMAGIVLPGAPYSLRFIVYLVAQFSFVSVFFMVVYRTPGRFLALVLVFGIELVQSTRTGLFHGMLLWLTLLASPVFHEYRIPRGLRLTLVLGGLLLTAQLQNAKAAYRELIESDPDRAGVMTLIGTFLENPLMSADESLNVRLNQGWIISAVMSYVPAVIPHEYGATIGRALLDSLTPRMLFEKREAIVSDSFRTYTGLVLDGTTSFGISVVGEAWANFGHFGILFMALFGAGYGALMWGIVLMSRHFPTFVLWTPLFLLQAIKMETELVVVVNHVVKSGILLVAIYLLVQKLFSQRL